MARKKPLDEQVVVVAGGSYGLGRAIARAAADRGAKVVVGARTRAALDAAVREVEAAGSAGHAVEVDVARRDDVERLVHESVERFGRVDTYIANAMVTVYAEAHRLEDDELRRVFDVNFFGGVYGFWAALPELRKSRGTFIQIASALSYRGIPLQSAYCSTKAALRGFFESARVEQEKERSGVDICVILPGAINTPQFDRARQKMGLQPQPVPPIYQPEPFAEPVVRCCERPIRELPLGWGSQKALWGQKLSPRAADLVLFRTGWKSQHTQELKPQDSPDNLFEPMPGDPGAHGRFDETSRESTAWTWLRLHRGLLGAGAGLATMGLLAARSSRFPP
ncbi:MAG: SDR family NAD(P)-dependent oxidoreductase [Actinobacteria bacterium]|nr:MAG: SDR family NAD(P)-dependent oxidoreductase [Actinomycetota bacterium]